MNGIREAVRKMMEDKIGNDSAMLCTVVSVSGSTCNVTTLDTEVDLYDVRLQAATSNGILMKPKVNSIVVVTPITDFEYVVIMFSDIDEITLLDGSFGGLVKVNELTEKVNNLEGQVNDLLTALQSITIPLAPSGTYPFAPLFASFTPLTPTQADEISNELITHGEI